MFSTECIQHAKSVATNYQTTVENYGMAIEVESKLLNCYVKDWANEEAIYDEDFAAFGDFLRNIDFSNSNFGVNPSVRKIVDNHSHTSTVFKSMAELEFFSFQLIENIRELTTELKLLYTKRKEMFSLQVTVLLAVTLMT